MVCCSVQSVLKVASVRVHPRCTLLTAWTSTSIRLGLATISLSDLCFPLIYPKTWFLFTHILSLFYFLIHCYVYFIIHYILCILQEIQIKSNSLPSQAHMIVIYSPYTSQLYLYQVMYDLHYNDREF